MTKIEWLKLLHSKNLLWNDDAFVLTEQDKQDRITSVDEKIDMEYTGDYEENYAEVKDGHKLITIMKGQEGLDQYVADKIKYMESDDLINLIRQMPGGFRSVLESAWNWKLQEDGEYTLSVANTMASLNVPKLLRLADRLDKKGLFAEANELDSLIVAHCGHCDSDKKKMKKKKVAQLVLAMIRKALRVSPEAVSNKVDMYFKSFLSQATLLGLTTQEAEKFVEEYKGKNLVDVLADIEKRELEGDPVAGAFIEVLGIPNAVVE